VKKLDKEAIKKYLDALPKPQPKKDPLQIDRYSETSSGVAGYELGLYVLYEDHLRVVEYLKQKIDKAYSDGKSAGGDTYSWRL
jgi:hypothetical protein